MQRDEVKPGVLVRWLWHPRHPRLSAIVVRLGPSKVCIAIQRVDGTWASRWVHIDSIEKEEQ